jgi:hypothetical protein
MAYASLGTSYHLDDTIKLLKGPSPEQMIVFNQMAATALDNFHNGSKTTFHLTVDSNELDVVLSWNSNFSKAAMREKKKIAEEGAISLAFFIMSVILDYRWVMQTEIGDGVDYNFKKEQPSDDNFLQASHNIEISGIFSETVSNNLKTRLAVKHEQINKGSRSCESSSIIITIFDKAIAVKEIHK